MRSKSSILNILFAFLSQVLTLIIGIVLPKLIINSYGSDLNGLISSIKQFIYYLSLIEVGLTGSCIYSLYRPLAFQDYSAINSILIQAKKQFNKSGIYFLVFSTILAFVYPNLINHNLNFSMISALILILGVNGALEFFSIGKNRALLIADQKSYIIFAIQSLTIFLNFILMYILINLNFPIVLTFFIASLSYILRAFLIDVYVKRKYPYLKINLNKSNTISLHQREDILIHQFASIIIFNSPIILLTFLGTLKDISVYSLYSMFFIGINGVLSIFNSSLLSGFGNLITQKDYRSLSQVYIDYEFVIYQLYSVIYSLSYIFIIPFIKIYSKGFIDANYIRSDLALILAIIGLINSLRFPQLTITNAAGHYKETRLRVLIEVVINISIALLFGIRFGIVGILFGTIVSHTYRLIDLVYYIKNIIPNISITITLRRIVRALLISILSYFILNRFVSINAVSYASIIYYGLLSFILLTTISITLNYLIEPNVSISVIKRIFSILNNFHFKKSK